VSSAPLVPDPELGDPPLDVEPEAPVDARAPVEPRAPEEEVDPADGGLDGMPPVVPTELPVVEVVPPLLPVDELAVLPEEPGAFVITGELLHAETDRPTIEGMIRRERRTERMLIGDIRSPRSHAVYRVASTTFH
jgi:hypothetical protein